MLALIPSTLAAPLLLSTHSTVYQSDESAASALFELKAKEDIVIYGLDVNIASQSEQQVEVYTKPGKFSGHENDESSWTLVLNSTVVGQGTDKPTTILTEGWDPVMVPSGQKQAFCVTFPAASTRVSYFETGDQLYYINHDLVIYGKGSARSEGWDGELTSPLLFNGGIKYVKGNETVEVVAGNIVGLPTVEPTIVSEAEINRSLIIAVSYIDIPSVPLFVVAKPNQRTHAISDEQTNCK